VFPTRLNSMTKIMGFTLGQTPFIYLGAPNLVFRDDKMDWIRRIDDTFRPPFTTG